MKRDTKFSDKIFVSVDDEDPDYMRSFLIKGPEGFGIYKLSPVRGKSGHPIKEQCEIATENIYHHIFTNQHEAKILKGDKMKLEKLKDTITKIKNKKTTTQ